MELAIRIIMRLLLICDILENISYDHMTNQWPDHMTNISYAVAEVLSPKQTVFKPPLVFFTLHFLVDINVIKPGIVSTIPFAYKLTRLCKLSVLFSSLQIEAKRRKR